MKCLVHLQQLKATKDKNPKDMSKKVGQKAL